MEDLKILRTIDVQGHELDIYGSTSEPLFLAVDVAKMLDYSIGNTSEMLRVVNEQDKLVVTMQRAGQRRPMQFVNEYGLYDILFMSRKPIARRFKSAVKDILNKLRTSGEGDFDEWLNFADPLVEEWEALNTLRESKDLEDMSWEDFLRSKGYTDEMLEDVT